MRRVPAIDKKPRRPEHPRQKEDLDTESQLDEAKIIRAF
jgi:hypothetical protein